MYEPSEQLLAECSGTAQLLLPLGGFVLAVRCRIVNVSLRHLSLEVLPTDNKPISREELIELLKPNTPVRAQLSPDDYEVSISSQEFLIQKVNVKPHQHLELFLSCTCPNQEYKDFIYELN